MRGLGLRTTTSGDTTTVLVRGDIDLSTAPQLGDEIDGLLGQGTDDLVLDLSEVSFIDSSGLGVIAGAMKRLRAAGGTLALQSPTAATRRLLDITGLSSLVEVLD